MPSRKELVPFLETSADEWCAITSGVDRETVVVFGLVEAIVRSWQRIHTETLAVHDLNLAEWTTIGMLRTSPPDFRRSPTELRRLVGQTSAGMTRVLTKLTDAGIVRRERSPSDGRRQSVILTRRGRALAERSFRRLHAVERDLLGAYTQAERNQLVATLDDLRLALSPIERETAGR